MQLDDLKNFVSTTENKLEYFLKKHKNNLLFLYGGARSHMVSESFQERRYQP